MTAGQAVGVGAVDGTPVALTVERLAFEDVYLERYPAMVRVAVLLLGDQARAEEVVQDAFVAAYLRQCVTNGCRDVLRRRRIAESLRLRGTAEHHTDPHEHVDDLLATLPTRQRLAVVLRFYDDQSVDQIAALLDTRPGTVKSLLHRAMAQLRKELEP